MAGFSFNPAPAPAPTSGSTSVSGSGGFFFDPNAAQKQYDKDLAIALNDNYYMENWGAGGFGGTDSVQAAALMIAGIGTVSPRVEATRRLSTKNLTRCEVSLWRTTTNF